MLLLAVVLLAGCSADSADSGISDPISSENKTEIKVNADILRVIDGTRATTIDNNIALQGCDLKIDAYFHGANTAYLDGARLHYTGGDPAWVFWNGSAPLHYYWPVEGSVYDPSSANITFTSLDFVGHCPYVAPGYITPGDYSHSAGPSFSCDLSGYMTNTEQASMQEYLIAVLNEQTLATQTAAPGGALPLVFKHPFALVKFVIAEGSGTHVEINGISIAGLNTTGTCTYDGTTMAWSNLSGSAAMSQTELNLKYGSGTTESTPFIVIPNSYGTKTLTVNATWDDWSDVTKDISTDVSFNWQPGYIYTYNLTVTKYALKVDTSQYTEQW